jgi:hypothetical protein
LDHNELSRPESHKFSPQDVGRWIEEGLGIEAGFEVWSQFLREQGGGSTAGRIKYGSQSALIQAIVLEETILERLAVQWNPRAYLEQILNQSEL